MARGRGDPGLHGVGRWSGAQDGDEKPDGGIARVLRGVDAGNAGTGRSGVMLCRYELIKSPQPLAAAWARIFTPDYLAAVTDASPHAIAVVQGYAMLGDGLIYFSDNGAEVLNLP